jgi:hypothetical protein
VPHSIISIVDFLLIIKNDTFFKPILDKLALQVSFALQVDDLHAWFAILDAKQHPWTEVKSQFPVTQQMNSADPLRGADWEAFHMFQHIASKFKCVINYTFQTEDFFRNDKEGGNIVYWRVPNEPGGETVCMESKTAPCQLSMNVQGRSLVHISAVLVGNLVNSNLSDVLSRKLR